MVETIGFFLAVSLLLYVTLAGADFGAGILELFLGPHRRAEQREILTHAMGPVWEANHMWLILAVVILFNGFPAAFKELSIRFHWPLTLMLIGITLRGCAFTFRHYDAVRDRSEGIYTITFAFSSVLTTLALGFVLGGLIEGRIDPAASDYFSAYLQSWLGIFPLFFGLFLCALFVLLAAVFLIGETDDHELRSLFAVRARQAMFFCVVFGVIVFEVSYDGFGGRFLSNPVSLSCLILATLSLPFFGQSMRHRNPWVPRFFAAAIAAFVVVGWCVVQYPDLIRYSNGSVLTLHQAAAPPATLKYLLGALLVGSAVIFPSLAYLLTVFKTSRKP